VHKPIIVQLKARKTRITKKAKRYLATLLQIESSKLSQLISSGAGTSSSLITGMAFSLILYCSFNSGIQQQQQFLMQAWGQV
jgi:hypothetical protein